MNLFQEKLEDLFWFIAWNIWLPLFPEWRKTGNLIEEAKRNGKQLMKWCNGNVSA